MSTSFPTQGYHIVYMCPNVIFQILPLCSRPMMSYHVTCHVTLQSHASFFFFFLNQQFITRRTVADHGSYFRNYVQRKHTNMGKREKEKEKEKEKRNINKGNKI